MAIETFSDFVIQGPEGKTRRITDVRFFPHLGQAAFKVEGVAEEQSFTPEFLEGILLPERAIALGIREKVLREWSTYPEAHVKLVYIIEMDGLPEGLNVDLAYEWQEGHFFLLTRPDRIDDIKQDVTNPHGHRMFTGTLADGAREIQGRILMQKITKPDGETITFICFYHDQQNMTLTFQSSKTNPKLQIGTGPIQELTKSYLVQRRRRTSFASAEQAA